MRRLDILETERAMELIKDFVDQGQLTKEQAQPVIQALFRYGMTEEAGELFDQSCSRLSKQTAIYLVSYTALAASMPLPNFHEDDIPHDSEDDVPFYDDGEPALEDDEEPWLPFDDDPSDLGFDPYAGQYLDDDPIDPYEE